MLPILDTVAGEAAPAARSSPPATAVTPLQMRHFYGMDQINLNGIAGDGNGQTIAIVDAFDDPNAANDLHQFDLHYGLPDPPSFRVVDQFGGSQFPATDGQGPSTWEVEESLDIEWAHVAAPAANIVLVEANSASLDDLTQAVRNAAALPGVVAVSMSWGAPENVIPNETSYDASFLTPVGHPGVTFVAASGDNGYPGGYPGYSPNVMAVGGTTISFAPGTNDGTYGSETGWVASGGGFSFVEPQPSYQSFVNFGNSRAIPDVSMDGDPDTGVAIYDSYDFGSTTPWAQYAGTSLGTPMWAALLAIANQGRALVGLSSLDGRTQTLPALYGLPAADFHDITSGSNGNFTAWAGYDAVTGIGTPVVGTLVNDLAGVPAASAQVAVNLSDGITLMQSPDHLYIDWVAGSNNGPIPGKILVDDTHALTINADGGNDPIVLNTTNGNPLPLRLSLQGHFTAWGLGDASVLSGRTIDINRGTLYVTYAPGGDPSAAIRQALKNGYNGGSWTGSAFPTGAIVSSAAQANPSHNTAVGYVDSADGFIPTLPANTIELKYTLTGDTNLDGNVDTADLQRLLFAFNTPGAWDQGDFNYDGSVNTADLQTLLFNFNTTLGSQTPARAAGPNTSASGGAGVSRLLPVVQTTGSAGAVDHPSQPGRAWAKKKRA
jgi:subtilase family serine protease